MGNGEFDRHCRLFSASEETGGFGQITSGRFRRLTLYPIELRAQKAVDCAMSSNVGKAQKPSDEELNLARKKTILTRCA